MESSWVRNRGSVKCRLWTIVFRVRKQWDYCCHILIFRDLKHRQRNEMSMPTGSEILPCEPSGHVSGCQNVIQPSSTMKFMEFSSLRSKRFQLSYGAKVRGGAKKKGWEGEGEGRRGNACPPTPWFWKTLLDISQFGSFVNWQLVKIEV